MSEFDATRFVRGIQQAYGPEQVDAAFTAITALKGAKRTAAIDEVEAICVREWEMSARAGIDQMKEVVSQLDAAKGTPKGDFMLANLDAMMGGPEPGMVMAAAFTNIHKIKGDKSHALVRAYAQEVSRMPEEEYKTTLGQLKLVLNVDAVVDTMPAPAQVKKGPRPPRRKGSPKP